MPDSEKGKIKMFATYIVGVCSPNLETAWDCVQPPRLINRRSFRGPFAKTLACLYACWRSLGNRDVFVADEKDAEELSKNNWIVPGRYLWADHCRSTHG
jgi:hypothetical protein